MGAQAYQRPAATGDETGHRRLRAGWLLERALPIDEAAQHLGRHPHSSERIYRRSVLYCVPTTNAAERFSLVGFVITP